MRTRRWPKHAGAVLVAGTIALLAAAPAAAYVRTDDGVTNVSSPTTSTVQGSPVKGQMVHSSSNWGHTTSSPTSTAPASGVRYLPYRSPSNGRAAPAAAAGSLPQVNSISAAPEGTLLQNFDGLSDTQNKAIDNFHDTPPDQGLCVGNLDGFGGKVVIEAVNSIIGIYSTSGTLLSAFNVTAGFMDPNAFSDPRCFWDPSTQSFYMTIISCSSCGPPGTADTVDDVLVVSHTGSSTTYQVSTNEGGTCFGDQPHTGYDSNALWIATDQFCGSNGNTYLGATLIGISKPQLAAQVAIHGVEFDNISLGGVPILTLEPAVGNASGTEYLLNSFPFDQFGNNNSISKTLGFWSVTGGQALTSGSGVVTLSGHIIGSETYGFPGPAASTGTGALTGSGCSHNPPINPCTQSEAFLNPDDDRMLQVQLINSEDGGLKLYAALDTALAINHDPSTRDGAAWFVLDPSSATIAKQGYVGVAGAYLLYPAILHTNEGTTAIGFTLTSTTINPSAADVVWPSTSGGFGSVQTVSAGTGPHISFAGPQFGRARWGDYSALALDTNSKDIWSATEYIGGNGSGDTVDNWGTRIWDALGDH